MFEDRNKSGIERLKKSLYRRKQNVIKKGKSKLTQKEYDVKTDWDKKSSPEDVEMAKKTRKKKTFLEKTLIVAIVFLGISIIAVLLTVFGGVNKVSTKNVDISVVGPASIESGGALSLQITITNNNTTDLELADLIIEYPDGTYSATLKNREMNTSRETLNLIPAGRSVRKEIKAILYGEENAEKDIIISLEYRIAGSNAIFFKDRKYEIKISSSPINLIVSPMEEVISGQEIEFSVSVMSNAENPIQNLLVSAQYPFGFEFKSATPKPTFGDNVWEIKDSTAEKSVIRIRGVITGQDEEERVFRFSSGTASAKDEKEIGALFASLTKSVIIKKPFIGIEIALNGDTAPEYISSGTRTIRGDVMWSNNSPGEILDAEIQIKLEGGILDKSSVSVDKGFFRSADNTIIWNSNTNGELKQIASGDGGRFSFSFIPLDISNRSSFVNPEISIVASVKGNRVSEDSGSEQIDSSVSKIIKISSDLMITPRATYYTGPFTNTGSLPPKVDQETTYTITWTITNTVNDVSDVKVSSSLPAYVRWMGVVSPSSENISYNPVGGEIVWNVGDVKSGTGIKTAGKEISFQVALLPSLSQVGQSPDLTGDVTITGVDRFTNSLLNDIQSAVTTRLNTDPGYISGKGSVVK